MATFSTSVPPFPRKPHNPVERLHHLHFIFLQGEILRIRNHVLIRLGPIAGPKPTGFKSPHPSHVFRGAAPSPSWLSTQKAVSFSKTLDSV